MHRVTVLPAGQLIEAADQANLLDALRSGGFPVNAPCGGNGTCGKCKVTADGKTVFACRTTVDRDLTVILPREQDAAILTDGPQRIAPEGDRQNYLLALDIGTTTVAGYLLDGTGAQLAAASALNPQHSFGADVISRIQQAQKGQLEILTKVIRSCVSTLTDTLCDQAHVAPGQIAAVSFVGNPAMQQLFLGIPTENLARIPFSPVLKTAQTVSAAGYLPQLSGAKLLIVPDIGGFVGADTIACVLATGMDQTEKLTLLVDIGTNGEMVLGNRRRMVACSAAAGPALEGANISRGMRGQTGAIDHVWLEKGQFRCSVIGGGPAEGICGSGLIDAVAAGLDAGVIHCRGTIQNAQKHLELTREICLTQEDIRQVQLAKGAIAAGIQLMAGHLGIQLQDIEQVFLAGAFGTYMDPRSACRIGLIPQPLLEKITAVGNAAGSGAKILACREDALQQAQQLADSVEFLELATVPAFRRCFAQQTRF